MNETPKLSPADTRHIRTLTRAYAVRFKVDNVLAKLIDDWNRFVAAVENGYTYSIFEYTNELGGRNIIEQILTQISPTGRVEIQRMVEPLDSRFMNATRMLQQPLRRMPKGNPGWWYYRVPRILNDELSQDLVAEGVTWGSNVED